MMCNCDFCTGRKNYDDNWCSRCVKVRMQPPKNWVDLDICDQCESEVGPDGDATSPTLYPEPRIARGDE